MYDTQIRINAHKWKHKVIFLLNILALLFLNSSESLDIFPSKIETYNVIHMLEILREREKTNFSSTCATNSKLTFIEIYWCVQTFFFQEHRNDVTVNISCRKS